MKAIKIMVGVFGWNHGQYELVKAGDPPIEVEDELAARLVEKGVAEYAAPLSVSQPQETTMEDLTVKELRELGKQYGLTFKAGTTKADMIEAIQAEQLEEDAPAFDAAEAVQ